MKKQFQLLATMLFATALIAACAKSSDSEKQGATTTQVEDLSYDITQNGCPTHVQHFASHHDMCVGLQDEELNNHCAAGGRADLFLKICDRSEILTPAQLQQMAERDRLRLQEKIKKDQQATIDLHLPDYIVKTLHPGESVEKMFNNPAHDTSFAKFTCLDKAEDAEKILAKKTGEVLIFKGTSLSLRDSSGLGIMDENHNVQKYPLFVEILCQ